MQQRRPVKKTAGNEMPDDAYNIAGADGRRPQPFIICRLESEEDHETGMRPDAVLLRLWDGSASFYTGNNLYLSICDRMSGIGI